MNNLTLGELLPVIGNNSNLRVTLNDSNGNQLINFNSSGWENIESDLLELVITELQIVSEYSVVIKLENVENQ